MNYRSRSITDVQVTGLQRHENLGDATVSGSVRLQLSSYDGNEFGPCVTVALATDMADNATFQDVERQLLVAAIDVLTRLASLTPDEAERELEKSRRRAYLPEVP